MPIGPCERAQVPRPRRQHEPAFPGRGSLGRAADAPVGGVRRRRRVVRCGRRCQHAARNAAGHCLRACLGHRRSPCSPAPSAGKACLMPRRRWARCAGSRRSTPKRGTPCGRRRQFGNACVQYGRIYGPGANNRYDADHRHHAEPSPGQRRLPVPEHLGPADRRVVTPAVMTAVITTNVITTKITTRRRRRPPGDRFRPWRQRHLRLHRRPGLRRRGAGAARRRGRRDRQLPRRASSASSTWRSSRPAPTRRKTPATSPCWT